MIAFVPVEGLIHVYEPGIPSPEFKKGGAVKVNLALDNKPVGSVTFLVADPEENPRATEMTYLLTGSYIRVQGAAVFDVLNETTLHEAVAAL